MTDIKSLKETESHKSPKTSKGQRLSRKEREKQIINEAINYFSEVGFSGQTRELARRLNQEYTAAIFEFEWVRMFIFSGIKGVSLYQQYLKFIHDSVLQQICVELRHEFNIDGPDQIPISQRELDLAWSFHGGIFYIAIRKFIYGTEKRNDFSDAIRDSIAVFISGSETVLQDIHKLK